MTTSAELKALSDAATQREWTDGSAHFGPRHIMRGSRLVAATGGYHDGLDGTHEENIANAALIVAAVNAYRSGQLVHVDEVEKLRTSLSRIVDRSENGLLGTSKVQDMAAIARGALPAMGGDDE